MPLYSDAKMKRMDKIGGAFYEIDDAAAKYTEADSIGDAGAAQRKAMKEIEGYLKDMDRLSEMLDVDDEYTAECIATDEDGEYDIVQAIYAELDKLDKILDEVDGTNSR